MIMRIAKYIVKGLKWYYTNYELMVINKYNLNTY